MRPAARAMPNSGQSVFADEQPHGVLDFPRFSLLARRKARPVPPEIRQPPMSLPVRPRSESRLTMIASLGSVPISLQERKLRPLQLAPGRLELVTLCAGVGRQHDGSGSGGRLQLGHPTAPRTSMSRCPARPRALRCREVLLERMGGRGAESAGWITSRSVAACRGRKRRSWCFRRRSSLQRRGRALAMRLRPSCRYRSLGTSACLHLAMAARS